MILDARPLREKKIEELKKRVFNLKYIPKLVIIRVGNDPASERYVRNKRNLCDRVGIDSVVEVLPEDTTQEHLNETVKYYNDLNCVTGILVQLPLPKHLDEQEVLSLINPNKEVDGFCTENLGKLVRGEEAPVACTPKGIMDLLDYYNIDVAGKDVLIINRSNIVGKPLAMLMLQKNATPTIAHSKTKGLESKILNSDIVITAIGIPKYFGVGDFAHNTTIIDVSMNFDENGKLCGDVDKYDYEDLIDRFDCSLTPVPNGVGITTVLALIEQVIEMKEREEKING